MLGGHVRLGAIFMVLCFLLTALSYEDAKVRVNEAEWHHAFYGVAIQYPSHALVTYLEGRSWTGPKD